MEITIKVDDVVEVAHEALVDTLKDVMKDSFFSESKQLEFKNVIRKSIETSDYESFVNAIAMKLSLDVVDCLIPEKS